MTDPESNVVTPVMNMENRDKQSASEHFLPSINIHTLLLHARRHMKLFIGIFIVVFVAVLAIMIAQPKKFSATAAVMVDSREIKAVPNENVVPQLTTDVFAVDTEVELVKSSELAKRVVKSLRLNEIKEFTEDRGIGALKSMIGISESETADEKDKRAEARLVESVKVKRQGFARVIYITYEGTSPEQTRAIVNEWAQQYLKSQLELKQQGQMNASGSLLQRVNELRGQVETAESKVQQFKIANNLLTADGGMLAEQDITTLNSQLGLASVDRAASEARLRSARRQLDRGYTGGGVAEVQGSSVIQGLRQKSAELGQKIAQLSSRYGERHPELIEAKRQKQSIDTEIQEETDRVLMNLESAAEIERQKTAAIAAKVAAARGSLAQGNRAMVQLNELERDAQAVRSVYEAYLGRYNQLASLEGLEAPDARIVSLAKSALPSSPGFAMAFAVAFIFASGAAGATVLGKMALENGVSTRQDIEKLGVPYLASIADLNTIIGAQAQRKLAVDYIAEKPLSLFAEGFHDLRTSLLHTAEGNIQVVLTTSSIPNEGKTTVSMCFAQTVALAGQSVVVIDCDLRRRSLSKLMISEAKAGLVEFLNNKAQLSDILVRDDHSGIAFIPLIDQKTPLPDIFDRKEMTDLIETLRGMFDVIVLDTAPILAVTDARILARHADAVVFSTLWRQTAVPIIRAALNVLKDSNIKVTGVLLNKVDIKAQSAYGEGQGLYYKAVKNYYLDS